MNTNIFALTGLFVAVGECSFLDHKEDSLQCINCSELVDSKHYAIGVVQWDTKEFYLGRELCNNCAEILIRLPSTIDTGSAFIIDSLTPAIGRCLDTVHKSIDASLEKKCRLCNEKDIDLSKHIILSISYPYDLQMDYGRYWFGLCQGCADKILTESSKYINTVLTKDLKISNGLK